MPYSELDIASFLGAVEEGREVASKRQARLLGSLRLFLEVLKTDTRRVSAVESLLVPDVDDLLGLLQRGRESAELHRQYLRDSYSAEPGDAIRDDDEEQPGKHKIVFRTKEGIETCYRGLPVVGEDQPPWHDLAKGQYLGGSDAATRPLSPDDQWAVLIDTKASAVSRVAALAGLRGSPLESDAMAYLAEELSRVDIQPAWRDAAVFAAEDTHFPPELREGVGEALLNIVSALRNQPDAPEKVVWSALRRGASLLPTATVGRLLAFLAPGGTVDTRSVALQCVARMYEAEPPTVVPIAVADRAHRFAERSLDPYIFTPGEPSLIARNAVSALAALGDPRLGGALAAVLSLGRPWLVRRVRDELNRVYHGWRDRGFPQEHPAVANLSNALAVLG
ncbi:MAG: hypothetical protein ABSH35_06395 [Isosphaeraceae bacterium]|jgi:hypothetical protein